MGKIFFKLTEKISSLKQKTKLGIAILLIPFVEIHPPEKPEFSDVMVQDIITSPLNSESDYRGVESQNDRSTGLIIVTGSGKVITSKKHNLDSNSFVNLTTANYEVVTESKSKDSCLGDNMHLLADNTPNSNWARNNSTQASGNARPKPPKRRIVFKKKQNSRRFGSVEALSPYRYHRSRERNLSTGSNSLRRIQTQQNVIEDNKFIRGFPTNGLMPHGMPGRPARVTLADTPNNRISFPLAFPNVGSKSNPSLGSSTALKQSSRNFEVENANRTALEQTSSFSARANKAFPEFDRNNTSRELEIFQAEPVEMERLAFNTGSYKPPGTKNFGRPNNLKYTIGSLNEMESVVGVVQKMQRGEITVAPGLQGKNLCDICQPTKEEIDSRKYSLDFKCGDHGIEVKTITGMETTNQSSNNRMQNYNDVLSSVVQKSINQCRRHIESGVIKDATVILNCRYLNFKEVGILKHIVKTMSALIPKGQITFTFLHDL